MMDNLQKKWYYLEMDKKIKCWNKVVLAQPELED